jgi:adenylate cyclase
VRTSLIRGAIAGALSAAIVCAVSWLDPTLFRSEFLLRDPLSRAIAKHRKADPRIVLAVIDDKSIRGLEQLNYGRPPYPRDIYALVVRELQRAGAAVIAFDVLFTEEDAAHPEADREFAKTIEGAPVVLAAQTGAGRGVAPQLIRKLWNIPGGAAKNAVAPIFDAEGIGAISLEMSNDITRTYRIANDIRPNRWLGSLALESLRAFQHLPRSGRFRGDAFEFDHLRVPVSAGDMTIRWVPQHAAIQFGALVASALAHDDPSIGFDPKKIAETEAAVRGKIVMIGYTAAGLVDLRANPLSNNAPGLELHANALDNLLNRSFAREAPRWLILPLIVILAALLGALLDPIRSQLGSAIVAVAAVAIAMGVVFAAQSGGLLLPGVAATSSLALTYVTITVAKLLREQEQTAMLTRTFGRYVSPQILDHILAHPELVHLGGERRDLTILFSDIRGFTSISEASEPEQVVEMLNEYLTRMVDILLAHGGTLDKFIGDAVMGFWNAPAADPDHARHAVACAVAMIEETARIRARWEQSGKASIRIGVGINTGEAVVGNIGAEQVFGYTVIGDAVNLASRLESKNKDYATEIIISEFTKERIGDAFELVYLDEVKVKGKERAVKIYQVTVT